MIIPIKRLYLNSSLEKEILINTRYIVKVETCGEEERGKAKTRIVIEDGFGGGNSIMYTNYTVSYIKGLITKANNKLQEQGELGL